MCLASGSDDSILKATDDDIEQGCRKPYTPRRSDRLTFLDKTVCARACARLLKVGQTVLQKLRNGEAVYTMKCRQRPPRHPAWGFALVGETGQKWRSVVQYLWYVYHSSAEFLPTDFVKGFKTCQMERNSIETAFPTQSQEEEVLRSVNSLVGSLHTYNSDVEVHLIGPGFFKGERRSLQHGSRTEMFYEYRAYCTSISNEEPASFSCFLRVANKILGPGVRGGYLRFRKPSEHAVCNTCVRLKRKLRFAKGQMSHNGRDDESAVRAWTTHVLSQWLDRQVYWALRSLSQAWCRRQVEVAPEFLYCNVMKFGSQVVCFETDGFLM